MKFCADADYQSAIRQAASLRYGNIGAKPKGEVITDILASIKERRS